MRVNEEKKSLQINEIPLFLAVLCNWKLYCILPSSIILLLFLVPDYAYNCVPTHTYTHTNKSLEIFFLSVA